MPGYANTGIAEVIPKSMFQMEQETLVFWETDDGKNELQHQGKFLSRRSWMMRGTAFGTRR
jgi:hypothetical protein